MGKIKILQYVSCMNRAGAETLLMNIYRNINREKYEFHFISHTKEKCDYDEEIKALGGKIIYLERPNLKSIKKYESDFEKISNENGPYDTIHCHMQLMNGLILKIAKKIGIKNRISHAHLNGDYAKDNFIRVIYRKYSKFLISKYTTQKLACSIDSGKYLYEGKDFILVNNAIDLNKFIEDKKYEKYLHEEFSLSNNIKIITNIGRFVEAKNHKFILKVFAKLIQKDENYRLILCGDGPLKKEIEKLIKELSIEKYVYLLGIRTDINKILLGTDIYFMPSILEGLPVALVEAQAAGCKCLISENIPKDCDLGLELVDIMNLDDSVELWTKRILDYNQDSKINFKYRKKKIIERGFDLNKNIKIIGEIYAKN